MRAVVYQHETHEGLGLLEPALKTAGFSLTKRFRGVEYHDDVGADVLVVLGGSMNAFDTSAHPFLKDELAVLVERLSADRPVLAICLGAQLLASAAGAEVFEGKNGLELGVGPVRWTSDALKDPVIAGVASKSTVAHWHRDTWKPVQGATLLASTDRYTQQGFRLGRSYAFQFHPELTQADWNQWLDVNATALLADGKDLPALAAQGSKLTSTDRDRNGLLERLAHHFAQCAQGKR